MSQSNTLREYTEGFRATADMLMRAYVDGFKEISRLLSTNHHLQTVLAQSAGSGGWCYCEPGCIHCAAKSECKQFAMLESRLQGQRQQLLPPSRPTHETHATVLDPSTTPTSLLSQQGLDEFDHQVFKARIHCIVIIEFYS